MTREDEIAAKAVRISTLKSLKAKRKLRISQLKAETEAKIREINIQYAEDPERLKAKYAAEDYAKSEKAKKKAAKSIEKEKLRLSKERNLRPFKLSEEIFSSIVQGIGAGLFIAATALLNVIAINKLPVELAATSTKIYRVLYICFGVTTILNYVTSLLHHALTNTSAKEVFKRLCRICVYLIIASAFSIYVYTAIATKVVAFNYAIILSSIVWAVCLVGIIMYAIGGSRFDVVNIVFYATLGWSGLFIFTKLYHVISNVSFGMLITSGIFYTLGLIFCSIRKVKFMHAIGNLIVLSASVYMFFSFFYMFPV